MFSSRHDLATTVIPRLENDILKNQTQRLCLYVAEKYHDFVEMNGKIPEKRVPEHFPSRCSQNLKSTQMCTELLPPQFLTPDGGANILIPCQSNTKYKS
jgi:hypothetical protein